MKIIKYLFGICFSVIISTAAVADWTPSGPINLQIGFGAGGSTDMLGRAIGKEIEDQYGWKVVVENKPGGGGRAMFTKIAVAKPDGLKIGMGVSMPTLINLVMRGDKLTFDLDSFDYLATVANAQLAMVARSDAPFDDIAGLIEHSKSKGGALVAFDAKPQELVMKIIDGKSGAGFKLVSTESGAEMIQNLLGSHVDAAFNGGPHIQYLESGDLKMLASVSASRFNYSPDTKTLIEQGYQIYVDPWWYIAAPAGLPSDAKETLAKAFNSAINSENVSKVVQNVLKLQPNNLGPEGSKEMMVGGLANIAILFGK